MRVLSWNIQWGRGIDGRVDLARTATVIRGCDADVVCLQEVAVNHPGLPGGATGDQVARLGELLPGYASTYAAGSDLPDGQGGRSLFGQMILSRLPLLQVFRHLLPHPAEGGIKHMQRQAIEVVVETRGGPLRVVTTHLEYYSDGHRAAQIERLRALQDEVAGNEARPPKSAASPYDPVPRPASLVLCGDLNLLPGDAEYALLFQPPLLDAWRRARPGEPHPPTTGLFDRNQWPMGGHCRDYFAVTSDVAQRIAAIEADLATDASDHQPVTLELRDPA